MLSRPLALLLTATLAGSLAACASTDSEGSIAHYIATGATNVTTSCGGGYQVFRAPAENRILVVAYAIPQAYKSICEGSAQSFQGVTGVRYEEAALEYLSKSADLKVCKVVRGVEITPLHSEFFLSCPVVPTAATPAVAVRAKG
jgi:hypothetical protein